MLFFRVAVYLTLWLTCGVSFAQPFHGRVMGISDGDTFSVMKDGAAVKIRRHGTVPRKGRHSPIGRSSLFRSWRSDGRSRLRRKAVTATAEPSRIFEAS